MSSVKKNLYVRKVEEEVDKLLDIYGKILQSATVSICLKMIFTNI